MSDHRDKLLGRWVHVSEEDTETAQIFRPPDYPLPPSRGRAQLAFYADHSVKAAGIGSNDVSRVTQGHWTGSAEQGEALEVTLEEGRQPIRAELLDEGGPVLKLTRTR